MKSSLLFCLACMLSVHVFAQQTTKEQRRALLGNASEQQRSAGNFSYMLATFNEPYVDLVGGVSVNGGEIWDDPEYEVPLPFQFNLNGDEVNSLIFGGLGALLFSLTGDPDVFQATVPFETDLLDRGALNGVASLSPISYVVDGAPGSRIFKLEWKNAGSYDELDFAGTMDMFVNLQLWFYEGSNMIEFRYGPSFINDGDLFYSGESGAYVGVTGIDDFSFDLVNPHFIIGPADNPFLSEQDIAIDGTPPDGMVYRLFLPQALEVSIDTEDGTCGLDNGSATAIVDGGAPPYTYLWSTGESTVSIIELAAGIYTVTVTDSDGATATASAEVFNVDPLFANASATDETAPDANDGTATANPSGGTEPYTYEWSTGDTDQTITDLAPGDYTVSVTDTGGCVAVETVTVNAFAPCPEQTIVVALSVVNCFGVCDAGIEVLDVIDGTAPFTYVWDDGSTEAGITDLCAGFYTVTVTDADGCTVSETFEITEPEELLANAGSTNETAPDANDGTAWAAPSGGVPPYTYEWSTGDTDSLIMNLASGDYTVTVTDANTCSVEATVTVEAAPCTLAVDGAVTDLTCFESCDGSIVLEITGGTDPFEIVWDNGSDETFQGDLCAGSYGVTVTDADGCVAEATFVVGQPDLLLANAGSTHETDVDAEDGTAWALPTGGTEPYSYEWNTGETTYLIENLPPGDYTVTVTDAQGCSDVATVTVLSYECTLLTLEAVIVHLNCFDICEGSVTVEVNNATDPLVYAWSNGADTDAITDLCAGTYSMTITDANDCVISGTYEVESPEQLLANAGSTDETAPGANDGTAWAAPSGGVPPYTYEWSTGDTDSLLTDLASGAYSVTVTDDTGCTTEEAVLVNPYQCLIDITTTFVSISCADTCDGGIAVLVLGVGPFTYSWSNGTTLPFATGLCAGDYIVTITDEGQGCAEEFLFSPPEPDPLLVVIEDLTNITDTTAGSITIDVTGGTPPYTFAWTGPDGFESDEKDVAGIAEGSYTLVVTDANGCVATIDDIEIIDETVSVTDPRRLDIRVFPNPAHTLVHLQVPDANTYDVELRSVDGRIIDTWINAHTLNVAAHAAGVYTLRVTSGDRSAVYRLVIAR